MVSEHLWPGPVAGMPEPIPRGAVAYRPLSERPEPVRFVDGTELFEAYVRRRGEDPHRLSGDPGALWTFLDGRGEVVESPEVAESAARFVGDVLAAVHPAATWRVTSEAEVGTPTRSIPVHRLLRAMIEEPEQRAPFLEHLATWEQDDEDDRELRLASRPDSRPLVLPAQPFERPPFPQRVFTDERGEVIRYGDRWPDHEPPEEAYSRVSNPERFAPLLLDLDALVDHLRASYVVDVDRRTAAGGAVTVLLQPSTGTAIEVVATEESVQVSAGVLFRQVVPDCSCDACDESAVTAAPRLEETLLGIAAGGLRERYPVGRRRWQHIELRTPDGSAGSSSSGPDPRRTRAELHDASQTLRSLDDGRWPAWTLRSGAD